MSTKPKVALGMSGGVDSSVCAHLLVEQGYDVTGVYLECWRAPGCRSEEDRKDALAIALKLGIRFEILDFRQAYKDTVVEYFFTESSAGRTPNPDVLCNKEIKFGLFYQWAMAHGYDFVATGHYAAINIIQEKMHLCIPKDTHKDQTYFLYLIAKEQLSHTLFPLTNLTKSEVRDLAHQWQLPVATKKDSVGICFIGDINVHEFLKERLGENPGEVVNRDGLVIGEHTGLWFYTIGQRNGFRIFPTSIKKMSDGTQITKHNIPPFYVIGKNAEKNQLIVGFGAQAFSNTFSVPSPHWIDTAPAQVEPLFVRIRHTGELYPCTLDHTTVTLNEPVKGIASGQSAVFYSKESEKMICWGGGVIEIL